MEFNDVFTAVKSGSVDEIKLFIEGQGIDVNSKDCEQTSLIRLAVISNPDVNVIKYLISKGADVNDL
jgi:ankyrin repeat protein